MAEQAQEVKVHIVWGCVYLMVSAFLALVGFLSFGGFMVERPEPIIGALIGSMLLSVVTVPLLLTVPGSSPSLLAGGRILLWVQAAGLLTAGVLILLEL